MNLYKLCLVSVLGMLTGGSFASSVMLMVTMHPTGGITTMAIAGAACAGTIYLLSQWAGRE